ncbi:Protein of unknown function [Gryllus bimaculatus]|nr:Protein of unknown function [Gryllus bimaculatus]
MVIEDLGRLGKGDYLFQMMPNRKLVRNYLYRGQLHSLRRLCIVDFQNDIDHTYDGAPPVDDPFDDDNDTTNAALGSNERLAPNPSNPSPEKGKKYVTGRQGPPQSGSKPGAKPRAKRGTKPSAKPRTKLGRDPDSEPEPQSEPQSEPQHEVEKPFGAACLKAASSKMGPIKKMFKENDNCR